MKYLTLEVKSEEFEGKELAFVKVNGVLYKCQKIEEGCGNCKHRDKELKGICHECDDHSNWEGRNDVKSN